MLRVVWVLLLCFTKPGIAFLDATVAQPGAPSLPVAFSTALSRTITLASDQAIQFDKIITNVGNGYDLQTGYFTAPVKGLYLVTATLFDYYHSSLAAEMVKNGNSLVDLFLDGSGHQNSGMTQTLILLLNKGDKIWVKNRTDGGQLASEAGKPTETVTNGVFNSFSGYCLQYME